MGLGGKLVSQTSIKSDGNVFYDIFKHPHKISDISPEKIERVDLERGQWGTVGSVVSWHFNLDGEKKVSREIVEAVDEKKKSITYTVIEGDLMEAYKTFKFVIDVDDINNGTNNQDSCVVTWTMVYEKRTEAMPVPHSVINLCINLTKEIERQHLLVPN